jgi:hypothetical protein
MPPDFLAPTAIRARFRLSLDIRLSLDKGGDIFGHVFMAEYLASEKTIIDRGSAMRGHAEWRATSAPHA